MQDTKTQQNVESREVCPSAIHYDRAGQAFASYRANAIREKASDIFGEKPYSERHRSAYFGASVGSYAAQGIGAVLAFAAVYDLAKQVSPIYPEFVGAVAGIVALVGLEYAKRVLVGSLVTSYLRSAAVKAHEKVSLPGALFLLGLVAVSVASSWRGGELIAYRQADRSEEIAAAYAQQADSLKAAFSASVAEEQEALEAFKRSVSWRGHIDFSKPETRRVVDTHKQEIAAQRSELRDRLAALDRQKASALSDNYTEAEGKAMIVACASLAFELIALACIRFVYVYLHRVYVEARSEGWSIVSASKATPAPPSGQGVDVERLLAKLFERLPKLQEPAFAPAGATGIGFHVEREAQPQGRPGDIQANDRHRHDKRDGDRGQRTLADNERECKHCGRVFAYKHWNARYCGDSCRIQAWEQRTGRTFKVKQN